MFTFFCVSLLTAMFPISPRAARGFCVGPDTEQALPPRSTLVEAKRFYRKEKKKKMLNHNDYNSLYAFIF